MADNEQQNDEYEFSDLDALNPESYESLDSEEGLPPKESRAFYSPQHLKRNVFIVIGIVVLAMILYKFLGAYFSAKKTTAPASVQREPTPIQPKAPPKQTQLPSVKKMPSSSPPAAAVSPEVAQKLSALEITQASVKSEVNEVGNELNGLNANINSLSAQLSELNQALSALNAKIDDQARDIDRLMVRMKPKPAVKPVVKKTAPVKKYFVQAVIPGRAWLIASNGTTLTVREGSTIPGYGSVKLIDATQGRVLTSSGTVIRFSQNDS